jgi:regulator of sirC expression with transglutaminase-like and TPR domain
VLTYDDLQNANLMRVIDRRKGLPVALGILYLHAGRAAGWDMVGLTFPGHFLIRLETAGHRAVLDPFNGGALLSPAAMRDLLRRVAGDRDIRPDDYRPTGNRAILLRLQNNILSRARAAHDAPRVAAVLESMVLIAPGEAGQWRDWGAALAEVGQLAAAQTALERYMELATDPVGRQEARALLQRLKQRLN